MNFEFLDKENVLNNGLKTSDYTVLYKLGSPVDITCMKKYNKNKVLAEKCSLNLKSDRLMCVYRPCNEIVFDEDFLSSKKTTCSMNIENGVVRVGVNGRYGNKRGTLSLSRVFGANGVVESDVRVEGSDVYHDCSILALGKNKDSLFGLFYIEYNSDCTLSTGRQGYLIDSWFDGMNLIGDAV